MRVLIVEDEEDIAGFVQKGLEAEHFAVDATHTGQEGLYLAKTNDYDVVVLDIRLPDMDGVTLCQQIREYGKEVPVIMLTVEESVPTKVEAFDAGADDYLTKPFAFEELLARIRALLRREKGIKGDVLEIGDIIMDTRAHKVTYKGEEVELSKKEFALLEYFMRNPGVLLTRAMILEHVWDMNADPFTNTVDVHVRLLRKKLEEDDKNPTRIQTVRGYGYKFVKEEV